MITPGFTTYYSVETGLLRIALSSSVPPVEASGEGRDDGVASLSLRETEHRFVERLDAASEPSGEKGGQG